jgi:hypothetical protein
MPTAQRELVKKLRICALGSCAVGVLFLGAAVLFVPRYSNMRGFLGGDGNVVIYSKEQYEGLLHALGGLFFVVFPLFGALQLFAAWMIWKSAKCASEPPA